MRHEDSPFVLDSIVGPLIEVDGRIVPRWFECEQHYGKGEPYLLARIEFDGDRWVPTQLTVQGAAAFPVRKDICATLGKTLDSLVTEWVKHLVSIPIRWSDPTHPDRPVVESAEQQRATVASRQQRRWITDEVLNETAEIYLAAKTAPTKAVREHFGTSPSNASRYVKEARSRGLIPEKQPVAVVAAAGEPS